MQFILRNIQPQPGRLAPALRLNIAIRNNTREPLVILGLTGEVSVVGDTNEFLGQLVFSPPLHPMRSTGDERQAAGLLAIHPDVFERIEELRGGEDLMLRVDLEYAYSQGDNTALDRMSMGQSQLANSEGSTALRIAQSDWTRHATALGYGNYQLLEIRAPTPETHPVMERPLYYLSRAREAFMNGEYEDTLVDTRKALETVLGDMQSGAIDATGITGSESLAKKLDGLLKKGKDFSSIGAHAGRPLSRSEAQLAFHLTLTLLTYVSYRIARSESSFS
ncbi:MAG: hypothetical protein ACE5IJ_03320 [Thermoplasmata archaeon]